MCCGGAHRHNHNYHHHQGSTTYDTYDTLFNKANGWAAGTSIFEIAAKGVALNKLVVGKTVIRSDGGGPG